MPRVRTLPDRPGWATCDDCGAVWEMEPQRRCYFCGENYPLGHAVHAGLEYHPEAESQYYRHCSQSERHQAVLAGLAAIQHELLTQTGSAIKAARQVQRDLDHPLYKALRGTFRH